MATAIFDTLQYAKKAKEVGFTNAQAEFQAEEIAGLINNHLVTKNDLKELAAKLIANLTIRFGSMLVVAVTVLSILMTIMHR